MPPPRGAAFDRWLQAELARSYDAALAEPVPEALLRLVTEREGRSSRAL
ncbi:hypothetical protein [Falsiroseomonas selenitidurans]|uniref:Anti-sigma factor NepR domain-containing protein n=1 Tax=Falsiroseomonas selenitidurans TaxID=2716335 RepID=A0ABX1DZB3_9PROT|nr:hypothetical protein [Falsiroseomonas selenitidurans]NKC29833.1 hypothetical protein [Falsiroseomonas selenitidurans]